MPELPDIDAYIVGIEHELLHRPLRTLRLGTPFVLRSITPTPDELRGQTLNETRRIGKRVALRFGESTWAVIHMMVAGRLQWRLKRPTLKAKSDLACFDFDQGALVLTEAGSKRRASLHLVEDDDLAAHDPGGLEPLAIGREAFAAQLHAANHTLKRALTSPRQFAGIGNAYSDEVLHAARLSPLRLSQSLTDEETTRLFEATVRTLREWRERLIIEAGGAIPKRVTAFRDDFAVHGRYGKPCPDCGESIQRIRYKDNETNYCAKCQTNSKLLKDRSLSRLLKDTWPASLDELDH